MKVLLSFTPSFSWVVGKLQLDLLPFQRFREGPTKPLKRFSKLFLLQVAQLKLGVNEILSGTEWKI